MQNLSVYDDNYDLIRDVEDDKTLDVALEIGSYLRSDSTHLSAEAEDVLYIRNRHRRKIFVEAMLFVNSDIETIGAATGMDKDIISMYRDIFFDTSLLRGQLGLVEFYEDIFDAYAPETVEFEYARLLREAHFGGPDIILAQFNIQMRDYDAAAYKQRVMKLAQFKHALAEVGDGSLENIAIETKAREAIINLTEKASKKDGAHSQSDLARLTAAIENISDKGIGREDVNILSYDTATEEVIDVEELEKNEEKDE